ncbi:MAG: ABC transporter permease [Pseudolysinimonas sp.]|uniref:ABC transporter permease n=1 Tax=Pseudolysinimonas sp. TaxID=2680009 RepID=UPI0032673A2A
MSSALVFARKEFFEIFRTWRIVVLPAIVLLFALTGPVLAKYTPELLTAVAGSQLSGLELPTPTVFDAYGQWIKNLSQIGIFAIIIIYAGLVSSERRSGTAILVLTKPLSRATFVIVKAVVNAFYLTALVAIGTLITWGVSALMFGEAPGAALWSSAAVWLVLALVYLSLMTLFSVLIRSSAGASGAGLGAFLVLSVAGLWMPAADYSPAGLPSRAATLAAGVATEPLTWPMVISLLACAAVVGLAAMIFRRQEL